MASDRHARLQVAKQAAYISGDELLRQFEGDWRQMDREAGLVRAEQASLEALKIFVSQIFPKDEIWARGDGQSPKGKDFWVVNQLAGRENFANGDHGFATTVAWVAGGAPVVAAVSVLRDRTIYAAAQGAGATYHDAKLSVSKTSDLGEASIFVDLGANAEARAAAVETLKRIDTSVRQIKHWDIPALELCAIAAGTVDGFVGYDLEPWDWVAAKLILEEAGGQLTDAEGQPMKLASQTVLASNGVLQTALIKALGRAQ